MIIRVRLIIINKDKQLGGWIRYNLNSFYHWKINNIKK